MYKNSIMRVTSLSPFIEDFPSVSLCEASDAYQARRQPFSKHDAQKHVTLPQQREQSQHYSPITQVLVSL